MRDLARRLLKAEAVLVGEISALRSQVARRLDDASIEHLVALQSGGIETLAENNRFLKKIDDSRSKMAPIGFVPPPSERIDELRPFIGHTYATNAPERVTTDPLPRLLDPRTRRAAMLQRLLNQNEPVRSAFEKVAGTTVVVDGRNDGTVTCCSASAMTGSAPPPQPHTIADLFSMLDQQVLDEAADVYKKQNPGVFGMDGLSVGGLSGANADYAGSVDMAVFQVDTDRLEQMYALYKNVSKQADDSANKAVEHLRA